MINEAIILGMWIFTAMLWSQPSRFADFGWMRNGAYLYVIIVITVLVSIFLRYSEQLVTAEQVPTYLF